MAVKVTGAKEVRRALGDERGATTLLSPAVAASRAGAIKAKGLAERLDYGFTDRTGKLRASVRILQVRDAGGRFGSGFTLESDVFYAPFVEFKPRTIDKRLGPPYWFGRLAEGRYARQIEDAALQAAGRAVDSIIGGRA